MYAPLYGEEGAIATGGKFVKGKSKQAKTFNLKEGVRQHLLCRKCDNEIIGFIEGRVKNDIDRIRQKKYTTDLEHITVDYKFFKLLQLSILWRASISSNWMFQNVSLGKYHSEKIRKMLLNRQDLV